MTHTDETVTVDSADGSLRLDRWFKRHYPALGHGQLEKLLRTGRIRVEGKRARSGDRVEPGQAIRFPPLDELALPAGPAAHHLRPADADMLQAAVLHRDDAVIVID
ncbi:MAG: RluA family pseudouridine synthase, partial [Stellaceae bacterium]